MCFLLDTKKDLHKYNCTHLNQVSNIDDKSKGPTYYDSKYLYYVKMENRLL